MSIDTLLQEREANGRPIHVGMVGAGATGRAIALQLGTPVPGIRLVGVANRTQTHAERAFREADITEWSRVGSAREAEAEIARGSAVLTDDPMVLTACGAIDVIVEVTGTVEPAAHVVLDAFDNGKHVVMVNAELDSLLGPILKAKADKAGVVVTHTDGDEPGVAMTLLRYLRTLGLRPVAAGNLKGMVGDYYRNPDTQRAFAQKNDQDPRKVTSFADATKLSMEATVLANATGFHAGRRGMYGPTCKHVRRWRNCCRPTRCLALALSIMRWGLNHTQALSSSFTRNHVSRRSSSPTTSWVTARSMSFTHRFICRTSRSPRLLDGRSSIMILRSRLLQGRFARLSR